MSERQTGGVDSSHPPAVDSLLLRPLDRPPDVRMCVPGSKSITNRALLCAALAPGQSRLTGALFAEDTRAMLAAVSALGADVKADEAGATVDVVGTDVRRSSTARRVDARQSGTTSRFLLPVLALSSGRSVVDGGAQLRSRPFGPLISALRELGADVRELGEPDRLPVAVTGPLLGDEVLLPGDVTSQFLSGLLIAAPLMPDGLRVRLSSSGVSVPYLRLTAAVMAQFGVLADLEDSGALVQAGSYTAREFAVEPDASAASYFLGAAAVTGGRVTIDGLGSASLQGDVAFADVLERMGARVNRTADAITVTGPSTSTGLQGIDVDMADISDTAQTVAAVAVFASTPTRVRGIGFIRAKETDRIGAIVTELRRAGITADEHDDGFTIHPGAPNPTRVQTYDDHRMAMSMALLGLRAPGIQIEDPGCVAKTYPRYFADLARLG
jgi:3-phosphoshikimate 1-carboxyvinyltransferase